MRKYCLLVLVVCLVLSALVAHADSLDSLMGWPYNLPLTPGLNYSTWDPIGAQPIARRVNNLVYPVFGLPALAEPGETIRVIVKYPNGAVYLNPQEWQVRLTTNFQNPFDAYAEVGDAVRQNYDMTVFAVEYDMASSTYHLTCEVPWGAPEDLFSLMVATDDILDYQPACVKVLEEIGDTFTFAHLCDIQVDDVTGLALSNQLNNGAYPIDGDKTSAEAVFENQMLRELPLLNPDFALVTGDLVVGLHYESEIEYYVHISQQTKVPLFMVPGNHDGYSYFNWTPSLQQDGEEYYARILGPLYYSFTVGPLHFVMINSYDGTPIRRSAGQMAVASPVDNWGGFLSEEQLGWIARDLDEADEAGLTSMLFMHHDPRGPYTANKPYPTNPFLGDGSEYWNYESAEWDSNPYDTISNETPQNNTGVKLMNLVKQHHVSHVFIGHNHFDQFWQFNTDDPIFDREGNPVGASITSARPLTIVQTTTMSAGVDDPASYNGYRLMEVVDGYVQSINFIDNDEMRVQSVPGGNLWYEEINNDGTSDDAMITVVNAMPTDLDVSLKFLTAGSPGGYKVINVTANASLPITDVGLGERGEVVLYTHGSVAGTNFDEVGFPPARGAEQRTLFRTQAHPTNTPPTASFITYQNADGSWQFDATASFDAEGEALRYFWDFGDGLTATNAETSHTYQIGGDLSVVLTVLDVNGGKATAQTILSIDDCCPDRDHDNDDDDTYCNNSCAAGAGGSADALPWLMLFGLVLALKLGSRKRSL